MQTIRVETGESRLSKDESVRVYIYYISPTGISVPFVKCPFLNRKWTQNHSREGIERLVVGEYELEMPSTFKVVVMHSTFGRPRENTELVIHASDTDPLIEFTGKSGFGRVMLRGRIDYKKSFIAEKQTGTERKLNDQEMKKLFNFKQLSAPKIGTKKQKARNLIW